MAERANERPAAAAVSGPDSLLNWIVIVAFAGATAGSLLVLYVTISQPILESYGFRQAQTALTSYWFVREGFAFAYQTPVVGHPWAIPFEFPLFQALVALIAKGSQFPVTNIGRAVSFAFFLATLIPVAVICRSLRLDRRVFFVFGSIYLLSPQYLFWGRTFTIESAATFFSVATIAAAIPLFSPGAVAFSRAASIVLLGSLAVTQKATTGLPVILVLMACLAVASARRWRQMDRDQARTFLFRALLLTLPVLIGMAWTYFTDVVKAQNEIGKLLTSGALLKWNFGTLEQRISGQFLGDVMWTRSLKANAGGFVGLAVMAFFCVKETRRVQLLVAACAAALFLLPLLLFTNLHIVHEYYQTATTIYVVFLLALALGFLSENSSARVFALAFALVLLLNGAHFYQGYWRIARAPMTVENNWLLAVAKVIREHTAPERPILVYGLEWNSALAYYAERKAMTVPDRYPKFNEPLSAPERYVGKGRIGALVICATGPGKEPSEGDVKRFLDTHGPFRETGMHNCRIFLATQCQDDGG